MLLLLLQNVKKVISLSLIRLISFLSLKFLETFHFLEKKLESYGSSERKQLKISKGFHGRETGMTHSYCTQNSSRWTVLVPPYHEWVLIITFWILGLHVGKSEVVSVFNKNKCS